MEAVVFIGVQGCGKSTFYKERFFDTHVRVSRDMLKTKARERALLAACLAAKQPFVLDNTNPLASQRAEIIEPARAAGFRVVACYFRCGLKEALGRNRRRPPGAVIPVPGVIATYKKLLGEKRIFLAHWDQKVVDAEWQFLELTKKHGVLKEVPDKKQHALVLGE